MPKTSLATEDWICIFENIAEAIENSKNRLNELDGAIGDGDHGVSMSVGFRAVREALRNLPDGATTHGVFRLAGRTFLTAAGGAIGPLIGGMWMEAGKALEGSSRFGPDECRRMLEAMEEAVVKRGKARIGDKTVLDALHPAVDAVKQTADVDLSVLLHRAAEAAEQGAVSTASMLARTGRSSRLGERTIGHQDAGATSLAMILGTIEHYVQS